MSPQPSGAQHVPLLPVQFLAMFKEGNIINSIVLFNVCHVCSSICIFFIKNYFASYASPFFFQEESWWRLTSIDTPLVSLLLSLPFPLCGNKVSWGEENFVLREREMESLPWWRSIRKTWQSCSWLWKRWWQLWASCSSSETWEGFFQRCKALTTLPTKPTTLSHYHCPLILMS